MSAGPFDPRTGAWAVRIDRTSPRHMGVIDDQPLPGGRGFVGVAHRVPAIPPGSIPRDPGYIELEQLSPTDGKLPGYPVEVRLYPDRRLGLGLFREKPVVMTDWRVPVDEWFYVVVEVVNGAPATQRLWAFDATDRLAAEVAIELTTRRVWPHATRTAQKVGGSTAALVPLDTYADDWFISTEFEGPLRIGPRAGPR